MSCSRQQTFLLNKSDVVLYPQMPMARLVSTKGPYLDAFIELDGQVLCVMDEFSWNGPQPISAGESVSVELAPFLSENEPWESIFAGNPEHRIGIEPMYGWTYRAFGRVVSINPVKVDIGLLVTGGPFSTHDERVVGEFVAFTIDRLDAFREGPTDYGRL